MISTQINPKDLTNEELEYVIQTGHLPPKFESKETVHQSKDNMVSTASFDGIAKINNNSVHVPVPIIQNANFETKSVQTAITALQSKVDQL